jgi:RNA polymerase sigma-B factor
MSITHTGTEESTGSYGERDRRTTDLLAQARAESDPAHAARLRERAVMANEGLAVGLATRFAGRGIDLDDLVQVAMLGLVLAARRYDPERGSGFSAFAAPTITGELKRHFRDHGWAVRPPRGLQELHHREREATATLQQELQREPTTDEVAVEGGITPDEVRAARGAGERYRSSSLDQPVHDDAASSLGEQLADESVDPYERAATLISLRAAMDAELDERERRIISLRFGADLTQRQIGERIGVSQMQVSRLITGICRRLRTRLEG